MLNCLEHTFSDDSRAIESSRHVGFAYLARSKNLKRQLSVTVERGLGLQVVIKGLLTQKNPYFIQFFFHNKIEGDFIL